jgi:hypothetical protein
MQMGQIAQYNNMKPNAQFYGIPFINRYDVTKINPKFAY